MKKNILIIFSLILGSCSTNKDLNSIVNRGVDSTKTNTYMVEYDFLEGRYLTNKLKAKVGHPIVYKIKNINQLAYEVKVSIKDSVISKSSWDNDLSTIIKEFRELPTPKEIEQQKAVSIPGSDVIAELGEEVEDDKVKNIIDSIDRREGLNKIITQTSVELSKAKEDLALIEREIQKSPVSKEDLEPNNRLNDLVMKKNELETEIQDKQKELQKKEEQLTNINEVFKDQESYFVEYIKEKEKFEKTFYELQAIYNDLLEVNYSALRVAELSFHPFLTESEFQLLYKQDLNPMALRFPSLLLQNKNFGNVYRELNYLYTNLKGNRKNLNDVLFSGGSFKFLYNIEKMKQSADNMNTEIQKIDIEKLIDKLKKALNLLNSSDNYEFISAPVQPLNDVVVFNVDIKKRDKNGYEVLKEKKFNHKEFLRHGLRYDISVGAAGSLHSRKYNYTLEVNKDDQQFISLNDDRIFSPSFVGFFTTSFRSSTHWTTGLSVGLGISAEEGTFSFDNFFVGPSVIIGRYERVMLTSGIALKNLPKLKEFYTEGDPVPKSFVIDNIANYAYRLGYFISLSYNLTKGVKDNIRQMKSTL